MLSEALILLATFITVCGVVFAYGRRMSNRRATLDKLRVYATGPSRRSRDDARAAALEKTCGEVDRIAALMYRGLSDLNKKFGGPKVDPTPDSVCLRGFDGRERIYADIDVNGVGLQIFARFHDRGFKRQYPATNAGVEQFLEEARFQLELGPARKAAIVA